jgi:hypothetical protein
MWKKPTHLLRRRSGRALKISKRPSRRYRSGATDPSAPSLTNSLNTGQA